MGNIFISYRQEDTMVASEQIYARLCERFGNDAVYKDIHVIPKGVRYDEHIDQHIPEAPVFLELIGPNWVNGTDQQGNQRLHQPEDLLRGEITTALRLRIPIIPVFIDTPTPAMSSVPEDVRPLLMFNGVSMHTPTLDADMGRSSRLSSHMCARTSIAIVNTMGNARSCPLSSISKKALSQWAATLKNYLTQ